MIDTDTALELTRAAREFRLGLEALAKSIALYAIRMGLSPSSETAHNIRQVDNFLKQGDE